MRVVSKNLGNWLDMDKEKDWDAKDALRPLAGARDSIHWGWGRKTNCFLDMFDLTCWPSIEVWEVGGSTLQSSGLELGIRELLGPRWNCKLCLWMRSLRGLIKQNKDRGPWPCGTGLAGEEPSERERKSQKRIMPQEARTFKKEGVSGYWAVK